MAWTRVSAYIQGFVILERNLLYPNPFKKDLTPEGKAICQKYDVLMRFHTKEKHNEFLRIVISEHRYLKRIQELKVWDMDALNCYEHSLFFSFWKIDEFSNICWTWPQEAIDVGCRSSAEADIYLANKRRNEAEGSARRATESTHVVPNNHGVLNALMSQNSAGTKPAGPSTSSVVKAKGYSVTDLLSEVVRIFFFCHVCI